MARFKDEAMERIYQGLQGKTPDQLLDMKIFGSIHDAFKRGHNRLPQPYYMPRNCAAYAAYIAGKETKYGG